MRYLLTCIVLFLSLILSIQSKPTPNYLVERADDTISVIELHHTTISRTATPTRYLTATVTGSISATPTNIKTNFTSNQIYSKDTPDWYIAVYGTANGISPQMATIGAVSIALGLFLCTLGFRLSKPMLGVMGFYLFATVTWIALVNCKPKTGYSRDEITMIVVPAGVGIAAAGAFFHFWAIAMYFAGAFGGFVFALFICTWKSNLVIVHLIGRSCFLGGMGLVCAVLVYFIHRPVMLFTTSFVGAYSVMFGIDCLTRVGFIAGPEAILNKNRQGEYLVTKYIYVLLSMTITLYLFSIVWQFIFNAAYQFGLHVAAAVKGKQAHEELHREEEREEEAIREVITGDHHSTHNSVHPSVDPPANPSIHHP